LANLFRQPGAVNSPPASSLRIQQAVQGKARGIGWGKTRIAGNLIWYGDFNATPVQQGGGGGKGTGGGAGGKGGAGNSGSYSYSAAVAIALCEGPITSIGNVWNNKSKSPFSVTSNPILQAFGFGGSALGFVLFTGSYAQTAWGYLTSKHPGQDLNYRGDAYVAAGPMQLGNNPEIPSLSFEVQFGITNAYPGTADANMAAAIADALTNNKYGIGFPSSRLDPMTTFSNYTIAAGLVASPFIADQRAMADHLKEWMAALNSEFVWSSGLLKAEPYGDQAITANGVTYTPPSSPQYDLSDVDFIPGTGNSQAPVICTRTRVEDQNNSITIEYLDATNDYNPTIVEEKDDAHIQVYGLKKKAVSQVHMFTQLGAAQMSALLQLGREHVRNSYQFTVPAKYILLDPMDIVTITDSGLGLARQWVRIQEITENSDFTLTMIAEDYLAGSASAPLHGAQVNTGAIPNYNMAPGAINAPLIFEPTDQLAGDLEIWGAVSGANLTAWGGCQVWVSYDGNTYFYLDGQDIKGPSRMGTLTAPLAAVTPPSQGANLDNANTLSIDLSQSGGQLTSGSQADLLAFNSLLYVDGEYIAWQNAATTGTNKYNLTALNRGGYGTTSGAHASGAKLCRVDQGLFRLKFTQDRIGSTVYFKFLSFNVYGGALQALADVGPVAYTVVGTALSSPLPDVQNFVSNYVGSVAYLDWDPITDFRPIQYEVRKGASWDGGLFVGVYAHPHVPAIGDAPYWIKALSQPTAGLKVYSSNAALVSINGSVIPANLLASYDEGPSGANWPGSLTGAVINDGTFIRTVTAGTYSDVFSVPDMLAIPDVFAINPGGSGYYTIPDSHIINVGRNAPCLIQIILGASGAPSSSDFFAPAVFFAQTDVFGSAANRFIDVHAEIAISTDGVSYGPWQKYAAGFYNGWAFKARVFLNSLDPANITAFLTQFVFIVYAPTRQDHPLVNTTIPAAGQSITFAPDGTGLSAAFNGGPNGGTISGGAGIVLPAASLPGIQATIGGPSTGVGGKQQGDDVFVTSLTLAGCFVQVKNSGVGVQRNLNLQAWGF
jgi:hypothetical protein